MSTLFLKVFFIERRRRDLNPRTAQTVYTLSRGTSSATWVLLQSLIIISFKKRRGWDSNPRALADKRFSRPPRYDHFDTSPYILSWSVAPVSLRDNWYSTIQMPYCQYLFYIFLFFIDFIDENLLIASYKCL